MPLFLAFFLLVPTSIIFTLGAPMRTPPVSQRQPTAADRNISQDAAVKGTPPDDKAIDANGAPADAAPTDAAHGASAWSADRDVDRMERSAGVSGPTLAEQNTATMTAFYDAFARKDGKAMAELYSDDAVFHDPAFGELRGAEIGAMWMMLTEASPSLVVKPSNIKGDDKGASGHWDADYEFSATGRQVHNSIDARMTIKDGKITKHDDVFSFEKWALQALPVFDKLGWLGRKMAGSGLMQAGLRHVARNNLEAYMDKNGIPHTTL